VTVSTTANVCWPSRLAYAASLLFTFTSAATNAVYGFNRGADLPSALIWLLVSVAASVVFALSVPALLKSLAARKWAQALLVCIGFVVCGSYSVVAALGSASGGRADAAQFETAMTSNRVRAQAAYEKAKAELDRLVVPKRSVAELEPALAAAKANPRTKGCVADGRSLAVRCPGLEAELARARGYEQLQGEMATARGALAMQGPPRQANSDAKALAGYLTAFGFDVQADALNKVLALLAVLVIELGGGASLAIGMALGDMSRNAPETQKRSDVPAETLGVPGGVPSRQEQAFPAFQSRSMQPQHDHAERTE
jgi:hypothetical protein